MIMDFNKDQEVHNTSQEFWLLIKSTNQRSSFYPNDKQIFIKLLPFLSENPWSYNLEVN